MANIRPNQLPPATTITNNDRLILDQGAAGVNAAPPKSILDTFAPVATQSEAEAGTDNVKRMTPLRAQQHLLAQGVPNTRTVTAGDGLTGGGTLEANRTLALSSTSLASLAKADSAVQSVNGKSGSSVALTKADVGLSNVDNTSDANKPISTATQTALNAKADSSITITAGAGLTGGGNLTANRTVALDAASIASLGKADTALQAPGGVSGQVLVKQSAADNDVSWENVAAATAVSYGPQSLTDAQQSQARQNIQADHAYDTIADITSATVPAYANAIRTNGYAAPGDGGAALYKRVASEPTHAGKVQSADGAWWELAENVIYAAMFGIYGTYSNTSAMQGLLDYAEGKELVFSEGTLLVAGSAQLSVKAGTKITWNGTVISRTAVANSYILLVSGDGVTFKDKTTLRTVGGRTRGFACYASDFRYTEIDLEADTPASGDYPTSLRVDGVRFGETGIQSNNIYGDLIRVKNFDFAVTHKGGENFFPGRIEVDTYRTAVWLQDVAKGTISSGHAKNKSPTSTGLAGENGVLIESTTPFATHTIRIYDFLTEDAGEHGFRIGGQQATRDVTYINCISKRSGAGSLVSGTGHGGSGFKCLGPTSLAGGYHQNIAYVNCVAEDVNYNNTSNFDNFVGFNAGKTEGLSYINPIVRRSAKSSYDDTYVVPTYSAKHGIALVGCRRVNITNPLIERVQDSGFYLYDINDTSSHSFGSSLEDVTIVGGNVINAGVYGLYLEVDTHTARRISLKGEVSFTDCPTTIRANNKGGGASIINCSASVRTMAQTVNTFQATQTWMISAVGTFLGAVDAQNGSTFMDQSNQSFKIRKSNEWESL